MALGEECFGITKYDDEYIIRLNGVDYNDKEKAYICENQLPMDVQILYKHNQLPVNGTNWDWSDCECNPGIPSDYTATVTMAPVDNFEGDNKLTIEVKFDEQENVGDNQFDDIGLKLKVELIDKVTVDIKKTHKVSNQYAFDENSKSRYPFYKKDIPWKFIPSVANSDSLVLKGGKTIASQDIFTSSQNDNVIVKGSGKNIGLLYGGTLMRDSSYIHFCGGMDTICMIDIYTKKSLTAEVYALYDTDDDFENYCVNADTTDAPRSGPHDYDGSLTADCKTPIDSLPNPASFECINRGHDGTLDLFYMTIIAGSVWQDKDNDKTKPTDRFTAAGGQAGLNNVKVRPSYSSSTYFCNERAVTNPNQWNTDTNGDGTLNAYVDPTPITPDIAKIQKDLNTVFNKVGIDFQVIRGADKYENIDIADFPTLSDGYLDGQWFHVDQFGTNYNNMIPAINTHIYYQPDLIQLRGIAVFDTFGNNMNTLHISELDEVDRTVPHEVGHAKFKLFHPDGSYGAPASTIDTGYIDDNLLAPVINDRYNFMNSGWLYPHSTVTDIKKYRIRRYQWAKIHKNY